MGVVFKCDYPHNAKLTPRGDSMKLTEVAIRKAKPKAKPYKMADGGGRRELHKKLVEKLDAAIDSREMHELIANKIEEDDFFVSERKDVLENMDADIGRDLILSKIDGWLVYLSMNKLLANYTKGYE
jgi:hypothetical protein